MRSLILIMAWRDCWYDGTIAQVSLLHLGLEEILQGLSL